MVMQEMRDNKDKGFQGGKYAPTEEELYKKAIALLAECKMETQPSSPQTSEPESAP